MKYLTAISLHNKGPYSISTFYIPHLTENGSWFWADVERNNATPA